MLSEQILYFLAKRWPSPLRSTYDNVGTDPTSDSFHFQYALHRQYLLKVKSGVQQDFFGKKVLEIGCGHGGISTFLAVNGAKEVHGVDINDISLKAAGDFKSFIESNLSISPGLPLTFHNMSAFDLKFEDEYFDVVLADNIFEHIMDLDSMMVEIFRVLKKGGELVIPTFNSIYSKHGLHLKHGLKMPWANVFFSEKTICNVMFRLAQSNPVVYDAYPGLVNKPKRVKDLRRYGDLNGITYGHFRRLAKKHGFTIKQFIINPPGNSLIKLALKITHRIPIIRNTLWVDVTSGNAKAVLVK